MWEMWGDYVSQEFNFILERVCTGRWMIECEDQSSARRTHHLTKCLNAGDANNEDCRWSSGRDGHEVPEGRGLCSAYSGPLNAERCQSGIRLFIILGEPPPTDCE